MRWIILIMMSMIHICAGADVAVRGVTFDEDKTPVGGIIVRLYSAGKPKAFTTSAADGSFRVSVKQLEAPAYLKFMSQKYESFEFPLDSVPETVTVYLKPMDMVLQEVVVKAPERRIKGDTIHYDVSALTKAGDRTIEDVIKKIPGISVDDSGGISYDGKSLKHFYIEDLDLLGNKYTIASQSINPTDISTISIYERHQDKKVLQGREESDRASLNLKLKKGRMLKPVGYIKGGAGVGDDALWNGELYTMLVSPKMQSIASVKGDNDGRTFDARKDESGFRVFSPTPFGEPSIKKDRFIDNLSAFTSVNTLFKLKKDLILKLNASYARNTERFDGGSVTEYLDPETESIIYAEDVGNHLFSHNTDVSLNIENNSSDFYFNNTFSFKGAFNRNSYDVASTSSADQNMRADNYNFSNILTTIINCRKKLFKINSETSFRRTPSARMDAHDVSSGEMLVDQCVDFNTFHNKEYTSLGWTLPRGATIGSALSFEIDHDKFSSFGEKTGKNPVANDLSGHRIASSAEPFIKFRFLGAIFNVSVPVTLYNIKYNDMVDGAVYKTDKVVADLKLSLSKRFNQMNHISMSLGRDNSMGDFRDFIDNPVFTTFRNTRTFGSGALKRNKSYFISGNYSCRNILESFYLISSFGYRKTESNTLSVSNVNASGTTSSLANATSHGESLSLIVSLSKAVRKINTTFYFDANLMWQTSQSIRSAIDVTTKSGIYFFALGVQTYQFSNVLMADARAQLTTQRQSFGGSIPSNTTNSMALKGKIAVFPVKNLEIYYTIDSSRVKLGENNYKTNTFMDAGAIYSLSRFDFELALRNLTNQHTYSYTLYNSLDIIYRTYSLRPLEALFSIKLRF